MMLLSIHHVQITIPPGAENEARDFYCGLLGLREIEKPVALRSRGGFWLELGTSQIHIGVEDSVDRERSKAHVAYQVNDLSAWREILGENSIEIIEGIPVAGLHRFEFRDPFGNRVEFLEKI